jgi:23S rRNA (guanosine2251-2'-O)-methyltransferase
MDLICGINPVLEALAAGTRHFDRLLIVKGLRSRRLSDAIRRATHLGIALRFEMRETLDRMAGGVPHQGIIAVVSEKPLLSLESLLDGASSPALVVVLDGVEDPRNLGAILRTAEAAGANGVVLPERHSAGLSETVARASAGALEHVAVARVGNLAHAIGTLKAQGIWVVGFDAAGTERWDAVDLTRPVAIVLGGEGRGIRRLVREHCDHLVSIPHFGHVGSLNVSVAAGIALYEAVRQRRAVPSGVRPIPTRSAPAPQIIGPAPDDPETDPGARPRPRADEDSLTPGPDLEPGADEEPLPVTHVDPHDDVAWGHGPTVLKPVGFNRIRRPNGRRGKGRRRHDGGRPVPGDRPPGGPPPGEAGPPTSPSPRRKGRRRRHGRRKSGGPSGPGGPPPNPDRSPGETPATAEGQGERPAGGGGRRRHRRRRHGHR